MRSLIFYTNIKVLQVSRQKEKYNFKICIKLLYLINIYYINFTTDKKNKKIKVVRDRVIYIYIIKGEDSQTATF